MMMMMSLFTGRLIDCWVLTCCARACRVVCTATIVKIGHNCSTTGPAASKYWASKGWKYTTPPWNFTGPSGKIGDSPCPKIFNFLNRKIENLDNFDNVTWLEKGIVTAA